MWRSDPSVIGVQLPSCHCVCVYWHATLENEKWDFLGPRFLEMQNDTHTYIYIYIYMCVCVCVDSQHWCYLFLKFGTKCCGVVSCPLELRRKNLLFPLYRRLRTLQSRCVQTFSEYPERVCWENGFDLWQKVCLWCMWCSIFFYHWHMLGRLHAVNFLWKYS
jgi:hypothetical protein